MRILTARYVNVKLRSMMSTICWFCHHLPWKTLFQFQLWFTWTNKLLLVPTTLVNSNKKLKFLSRKKKSCRFRIFQAQPRRFSSRFKLELITALKFYLNNFRSKTKQSMCQWWTRPSVCQISKPKLESQPIQVYILFCTARAFWLITRWKIWYSFIKNDLVSLNQTIRMKFSFHWRPCQITTIIVHQTMVNLLIAGYTCLMIRRLYLRNTDKETRSRSVTNYV